MIRLCECRGEKQALDVCVRDLKDTCGHQYSCRGHTDVPPMNVGSTSIGAENATKQSALRSSLPHEGHKNNKFLEDRSDCWHHKLHRILHAVAHIETTLGVITQKPWFIARTGKVRPRRERGRRGGDRVNNPSIKFVNL